MNDGYLIPDSCQIDRNEILKIYYEVFGYRHFGTFAEIGAFDGKTYGCTYGLAYAGWRGLYVEAVPEFAEVCKKNHAHRPGVVVENVAVLDYEGETAVYTCGECSSTKLTKFTTDWGCSEERSIVVPCTTLNRLYQKHKWPRKYDLLVVDVEEAEIDVLKDHDLDLWTPKLAIIETHESCGSSQHLNEDGINEISMWCDAYFMGKYSYEKIYFDAVNTIYLKNA